MNRGVANEEVGDGDEEDNSALIIVLQTEQGRKYCCGKNLIPLDERLTASLL